MTMYNNSNLEIYKFLPIIILSVLCSCAGRTFPSGEIRPGEIWYDTEGNPINAHGGGMLYHNGRYWWYGEYKTAGEEGNLAQVGVSCYSSSNLSEWRNEGIVLPVSEDEHSEIAKGCILERPKVIYNSRTGKFVMWFHLELKGRGYSSARSGIAVADRPEGPFTYLKSTRCAPGHYPLNSLPLHKGPHKTFHFGDDPDSVNVLGRDLAEGQMTRDMQLFVDDDGRAYQLAASEENSTLHIAELNEDYTDYTGRYVRAFVNRYMEAPAVFKKDGLYWFMGSDCTGWLPNAARSAVAPSIWGPWTELGNPCEGDDAETTFHSQSTYILPVAGCPDKFIYMGDRWNPKDAQDGRYIWLPITFEEGHFIIRWQDSWEL